MPAFVFATRAAHAAALPLLDQLGESITVLRNPVSGDARLVHVVTADQFVRLRGQFAVAGIEIEVLEPAPQPTSAPALAPSSR